MFPKPDADTGLPKPENHLSVLTDKETSIWAIKQLGDCNADLLVEVYLNQFDIYKDLSNLLSYKQRKKYDENLPPNPPRYLPASNTRPALWQIGGWTFSIENKSYYLPMRLEERNITGNIR